MENKRQNYYCQFSSNKSYALEITSKENKYHYCQLAMLPHGKKCFNFNILIKNPFST